MGGTWPTGTLNYWDGGSFFLPESCGWEMVVTSLVQPWTKTILTRSFPVGLDLWGRLADSGSLGQAVISVFTDVPVLNRESPYPSLLYLL